MEFFYLAKSTTTTFPATMEPLVLILGMGGICSVDKSWGWAAFSMEDTSTATTYSTI